VLADRSLKETHDAARRLLAFVRFRLEPEERLRELSRSLAAPKLPATLRQDVTDLTLLFDRFTQSRVESLATSRSDLDLADWVLTFQTPGPARVRTRSSGGRKRARCRGWWQPRGTCARTTRARRVAACGIGNPGDLAGIRDAPGSSRAPARRGGSPTRKRAP
jgi:hypothetical protein